MTAESVAIVGGGLVGSLVAVLLAQKGYHVKVFERRSDLRLAQQVEGNRSINLALSVRGISALKLAGLDEEVLATTIPMHARMIHPKDTSKEAMPQPYGVYGESINSVDRKLLNKKLLDRAEEIEGVELYFEHPLVSLSPEAGELIVLDKQNDTEKVVKVDYIIGCDGAYSAVRQELMKRQPMDFEQHYINHGYKELCIRPDAQGNSKLPKNYLHIWPREKFMLIALPNQDNSFTVTLFYPYEDMKALGESGRKEDVLQLFKEYFPDALQLIGEEELLEDFFANPAGPLVTVKMQKYNYKDLVVMLGDAIHAMVPFYGQGMNAGFEDVEVLMKLLKKCTLSEAIQSFTEVRRADAHAICDLALYNYTEMSTLVLSRRYLAKKWLYSWLHRLAPTTFVPLYSMVSFSQIPYNQAIQQKERQEMLVNCAATSVFLAAATIVGMKLLKKMLKLSASST